MISITLSPDDSTSLNEKSEDNSTTLSPDTETTESLEASDGLNPRHTRTAILTRALTTLTPDITTKVNETAINYDNSTTESQETNHRKCKGFR